MWHSWHPIQTKVPTALLMILHPVNMFREAVAGDPSVLALSSIIGDPDKTPTSRLWLTLAQADVALVSETADGRTLLLLSLSHAAFAIVNKC